MSMLKSFKNSYLPRENAVEEEISELQKVERKMFKDKKGYIVGDIMEKSAFREEAEKERCLFELQQKYEDGRIRETDLNEEEIRNLIELYKRQMKDLQKDIDYDERTSQKYREKILEIRKKLKI